MNQKSARLAVWFGCITFLGYFLLSVQMADDLGLESLPIESVIGAGVIFASVSAVIGFVWGMLFPPRQN